MGDPIDLVHFDGVLVVAGPRDPERGRSVWLYHASTCDGAKAIVATRSLRAKGDGVAFQAQSPLEGPRQVFASSNATIAEDLGMPAVVRILVPMDDFYKTARVPWEGDPIRRIDYTAQLAAGQLEYTLLDAEHVDVPHRAP